MARPAYETLRYWHSVRAMGASGGITVLAMVPVGSIATDAAATTGLAAAAIAVCGFLAHARPALTGASERRVREATVTGGLGGFVLAIFVVVLSVLIG